MNESNKLSKNICVIGAAVIDIIVRVKQLPKSGEDLYGEHVKSMVGGCAYNVQQVMNHFSLENILFAPVGKGPYADMIRSHLKKHNIPIILEDPSLDNGWNISFVEPGGERTFLSVPGIETVWKDAWFDRIRLHEYDYIYVSGYELEGPSGEVIVNQLRTKKAPHATVVFDPGPRVSYIDQAVLKNVLQLRTIVHGNLNELLALVSGASLEESARKLHLLTNEAVIVTLGNKGCFYFDGHHSNVIPTTSAVPVVDTIGAGDAHTGAFISGIAQGLSVKEACQLGNDISAKVVQQTGGDFARIL